MGAVVPSCLITNTLRMFHPVLNTKVNKLYFSVISQVVTQSCKKCSAFLRVEFEVFKPSSRQCELWHSQIAKYLNYVIQNRLLIYYGLVLNSWLIA